MHHQSALPQTTTARRPWTTLLVLCLAQFMVILDITVVNVALPSIGADLRLSPVPLTWLVTAYTLCFGGLLLLGGRLADAYGPRRSFLIGLAVFTLASLASGVAQDGATLIAARSAQGVGAALLSPAALALVVTTFSGPQQRRALGVWAAVASAGGALGVLVGGALTQSVGWRWNFLVNLPVGIVVGLLLPMFVPRVRTARIRRLDLPGALLATLATGLVIFGLVRAGTDDPGVGVIIGAGVVVAAVLVVVERNTPDPLVPPGVFARRTVVTGQLTMLAASAFMLSTFFLTSLVLQRVLGLSALGTGLVFLPVGVLTIVGSHLAVHALGRVGPAATGTVGFAFAATGGGLLAFLSTGDRWYDLLPGLLLLAFGAGVCFVTATTTTMAQVAHHHAGVTSGLLTTAHELGASLGVAAVSALAAASIGLTAGATVHSGADLTGFARGYLALAVAAAAMTVATPWLLPRTRIAGDGPAFVH